MDRLAAFGWAVDSVDGHDAEAVHQTLGAIKSRRDGKPKALVANTLKGRAFLGSKISHYPISSIQSPKPSMKFWECVMLKPTAMRDSFLRQILARMEKDDRVFFVSADFGSPVLDHIRENYPDRFINVGVAEQNLINVSAGLAIEGFKVFAYAIAPFITMRCFEQLRVNLALLSEVRTMNVNLIGVGAGYSYVVSGPTHQCYEDLSLVRSLPNFRSCHHRTMSRQRVCLTIVSTIRVQNISVLMHRCFRLCVRNKVCLCGRRGLTRFGVALTV